MIDNLRLQRRSFSPVDRAAKEGDLVALDLFVDGDEIHSEEYPDALARVWSALHCPGSGDLIITPVLGYEFFDWGGVAHVGGGTHGSLHKADSAAQLIVTGTGESRREQRAWSIADVNSLVLEHFGIEHRGIEHSGLLPGN